MFPYARRSAVSEPTPRNLSQRESAKRWLDQRRYCLACPDESPSASTDIVKRPMSCSVLAEAPLEVWGRRAKHCQAWSFDERSKSPLALRGDRWLDAESCHNGPWQKLKAEFCHSGEWQKLNAGFCHFGPGQKLNAEFCHPSPWHNRTAKLCHPVS